MRRLLIAAALGLGAAAGAMGNPITCSGSGGPAVPGECWVQDTPFQYNELFSWSNRNGTLYDETSAYEATDAAAPWSYTTLSGLAVGASSIAGNGSLRIFRNTDVSGSGRTFMGRFNPDELVLDTSLAGAGSDALFSLMFDTPGYDGVRGVGFYINTVGQWNFSATITAYDDLNNVVAAYSIANGSGGPCYQWSATMDGDPPGWTPHPCTGLPGDQQSDVTKQYILDTFGTSNDTLSIIDPSHAPFLGIRSSSGNIKKVVFGTDDPQGFLMSDLRIDWGADSSSSVPEPGITLLLGGGLAVIALRYRRQEKS